jgi:glycosyltransferase involved in cell wall biosynthesis
MSRDLSVIIPARNEEFLHNTVASVLEASVLNTEVIAILDGYSNDYEDYVKNFCDIYGRNDSVKIIINKKAIGQRQATNQGVRESDAKFIMKLDAHCSLGKEYDRLLTETCKYDWTVIPRMYVLDAFHWVCTNCKKEFDQGPKLEECKFCHNKDFERKMVWKIKRRKGTDYMWIDKNLRMRYFDSNGLKPYGENIGELKRKYSHKLRDWAKGNITDVMCCIGACWLLHRERYWELGGMDEEHGSWGQMAVELAMKSFLSGGRQVINKNTWFAHLPRTQPGFTWPYPMSVKQQEVARKHSRNLWMNDAWPQAKYKLKDFISWFSPLPGWDIQPESDATILYYTANKSDSNMRDKVIDQIMHANGGKYPIVSVSQKPIKFGKNICVGDIGASLENVYRQVLTGAREAKTKYVILCEDDTLYVPEHFSNRPNGSSFIYNLSRWNLHLDRSLYSYRERCVLSQCIAVREDLIKCLEERFSLPKIPKKYCGEPGIFEHKLNLPRYKFGTFKTKEPNVVVFHKNDTSGEKRIGKQAEPVSNLEPWGDAKKLSENLVEPVNTKPAKKERKVKGKRSQYSFIKSKIFKVSELIERRMDFVERGKSESLKWFMVCFREFMNHIHTSGCKSMTKLEFMGWDYYNYLVSKLNPADREPKLTRKGQRRVFFLMQDAINLYHDIRRHGLKSPLEMYWEGEDRLVLFRGGRRLEIINILGMQRVPARIFKTKKVFQKLNPDKEWKQGFSSKTWDNKIVLKENSIHAISLRQFMKYGRHATDKYWVHDYTKLYDKEVSYLRNRPVKVLEIGVKRGSSLKLWDEVFPEGTIYGIDIDPEIKMDGFKVFHGSQADPEFLNNVVKETGPLDFIVDDGSHIPKHQLISLKALWPYIASQGTYVIEDLHWNYRADLDKCAIDECRRMIDEIYSLDVASVSFYYNIVFIKKL